VPAHLNSSSCQSPNQLPNQLNGVDIVSSLPSKLPRAILFDLDDTIIEFHALAAPAWDAAISGIKDELQGFSPIQVRDAIDRVSVTWWADPERHRLGRLDLARTRRQNVSTALRELGLIDDDLVDRIVKDFEQRRFAGLRLFPGALKTLEYFHEAGVRLGLVTNGDGAGQRAKIERFDLARFFDCIVIEGEFGVGKPDERVFKYALSQLGVDTGDAWMVGDNPSWEITPAQRIGLQGIWVDVHGTGLSAHDGHHPDRIIRQISELLDTLPPKSQVGST
jgi:putative hydrolase of the HAD superfamily